MPEVNSNFNIEIDFNTAKITCDDQFYAYLTTL